MIHIPVLQKEVIRYLNPKPGENFIDATIGGGGHTAAILEKNGPNGKVLGIDRDPEILKCLRPDLKHFEQQGRLILDNNNFVNLKKISEKCNFKRVNGILFDLGMCKWHLEGSGRGFSFQKDEPLDMRYDFEKSCLTAQKIINEWSEEKIERILREYGEERFAKRIARKIAEMREVKPIKTTFQLKDIILRAIPQKFRRGKIHCATRIFQALRIAVNQELENLKIVLPQALEILEPGAKIVLISFHSGEDRIVKNFFREKSRQRVIEILTKKPIKPTLEEIKINPCSRSAKLRAIQKN
jgi:16S rRNA (cytosine1402-N4)-methyltransferase